MARNTRKKILDTANRLFYQEGINAVGVDRIVAEAGIAKTTLYTHFRSKEALVEAYLTERHDRAMLAINAVTERAGPDPFAQCQALFDQLKETVANEGFRGCSFLLAISECENFPGVRKIVLDHKRDVRDVFRTVITRIPTASQSVADQISLLYEGALASAAVERSPETVVTAFSGAQALLAFQSTA